MKKRYVLAIAPLALWASVGSAEEPKTDLVVEEPCVPTNIDPINGMPRMRALHSFQGKNLYQLASIKAYCRMSPDNVLPGPNGDVVWQDVPLYQRPIRINAGRVMAECNGTAPRCLSYIFVLPGGQQ